MAKVKKEKAAPKKAATAAKVKKPAPKAAKVKPAVKVTKVKPAKPVKVAAAKIKKAVTPKIKTAPAPKPVVIPKPAPVSKPVVPPKPPVPPKPQAQVVPPKPAPVAPKPQVKPPVTEKPAKPVAPQAPAAPKVEPKVEVKAPAAAPMPALKDLELKLPITLKDLAIKLQEKPSVLIKMLMGMRIMVGINQSLDEETTGKICAKYGFQIKHAPDEEEVILGAHQEVDKPENLRARSPIVTFMGHVDHGKTSLLDAIRKTKVAESEHGGITQHIGAYRVVLHDGEITFLDTPGHEAFSAMRARGASVTDIVVLVVAADDGIMPQTQEAIDHARAAKVPIIVAINKIDKPQANIDRVKKQLSGLDLRPEDWEGKTITVPVSAKTGEGIDNLLEMIVLEAQMLELKADAARPARGVVIEAKMAKGRGPVSTLLVQNGTLRLNENIIVGNFYGKVRAMFDDHGRAVSSAGPSRAVEVLGISDVPQAGEQFFVIADDKQAKDLAQKRLEKEKEQSMRQVKRISLEELHAQIAEGKIKELKIIIKADVQGSLEAIKDTLGKLQVAEIKLDIIHAAVGGINPSDVILAVASNALVVGFNVGTDERAKEIATKEGIDIRLYNIIYELANDIKAAVEGMLEPRLKKNFLGKVEVRKVFKLSRSGTVAGCFVAKGKINRSCVANLVRNGEVIFEGKVASLKRFKDDVREVAEGFECGLSLAGFDQVMEGDVIEAYEIEKIARKL